MVRLTSKGAKFDPVYHPTPKQYDRLVVVLGIKMSAGAPLRPLIVEQAYSGPSLK